MALPVFKTGCPDSLGMEGSTPSLLRQDLEFQAQGASCVPSPDTG